MIEGFSGSCGFTEKLAALYQVVFNRQINAISHGLSTAELGGHGLRSCPDLEHWRTRKQSSIADIGKGICKTDREQ